MEYQALIPGYADEFNAHPEEKLAELGFSYTPADISFGPNTIEDCEIKMHPLHPGTPAEKYAQFMDNKLKHRSALRQACEPEDKTMKKWRARQIARCMIQLGPKSRALIHAPFTLELSDGCSVGCEFCALASGGLKSIFKYTPENAGITIGAKPEGNMAVLWVEDEGQGIPESDEDKVFELFYTGVKRSPDSRRGIGLGLALCRSIVQAHGGEIKVSNIQPHGARFLFTLPIAEVEEYEQ